VKYEFLRQEFKGPYYPPHVLTVAAGKYCKCHKFVQFE
jgi:hypothetical protein